MDARVIFVTRRYIKIVSWSSTNCIIGNLLSSIFDALVIMKNIFILDLTPTSDSCPWTFQSLAQALHVTLTQMTSHWLSSISISTFQFFLHINSPEILVHFHFHFNFWTIKHYSLALMFHHYHRPRFKPNPSLFHISLFHTLLTPIIVLSVF